MIPCNLKEVLSDLSHTIMSKQRVLLICSQHLFGESIETILRAEEDLEFIGPWNLNDRDTFKRLAEVQPSVVVIAAEHLQNKVVAQLTEVMIEHYPELSVIRTGLSENVLRIFSMHTLPARGTNLVETIRSLPVQAQQPVNLDNQ